MEAVVVVPLFGRRGQVGLEPVERGLRGLVRDVPVLVREPCHDSGGDDRPVGTVRGQVIDDLDDRNDLAVGRVEVPEGGLAEARRTLADAAARGLGLIAQHDHVLLVQRGAGGHALVRALSHDLPVGDDAIGLLLQLVHGCEEEPVLGGVGLHSLEVAFEGGDPGEEDAVWVDLGPPGVRRAADVLGEPAVGLLHGLGVVHAAQGRAAVGAAGGEDEGEQGEQLDELGAHSDSFLWGQLKPRLSPPWGCFAAFEDTRKIAFCQELR